LSTTGSRGGGSRVVFRFASPMAGLRLAGRGLPRGPRCGQMSDPEVSQLTNRRGARKPSRLFLSS
jgi:hypothetical protein